ncbi:MAG: hypothetical protein AAFZ80_03765 [Cyanobacteria bacterium P01_A01_bin.105]
MDYVLLIDDCTVHQEILTRELQTQGILCIPVSTVEEGLQCVSEALPTLVILEPLAISCKAFDFYQQLQNNPRTRRIPIIMLTAASRGEVKRFTRSCRGQVACLSKPYQISAVLSAVQQMAA